MHVEFYWGNLLRNAHLEERERDGRITFTWSFGTYDVAGAGLHHVMFFVMCGVYPLDSADALTCILLLHLLASRLWDSHSPKSRIPLLWRGSLDLCFQVLCFQWLGGGTDCCKPDNINEQSNLLHCNYSSVQRWDHYRLFPLSCLQFSVLKALTACFYILILSGTCRNILYVFKHIVPYVAEYFLVEYRV